MVMSSLHIILTHIVLPMANLFKYFHPKIRHFAEGQKEAFRYLKTLRFTKPPLWVHVSSIGEYELAVPVLSLFKEKYPAKEILLTFFSPSGYLAKRENSITDKVCYLPIDKASNAKKFLSIVNPDLVFIVKNDFWPNYLKLIKQRNIPAFLISGRFRPHQFSSTLYGAFIANKLSCFTRFFVINQVSAEALQSIGYQNVSITGDTGVDRMFDALVKKVDLGFVSEFKNHRPCVVIGSAHKEDLDIWLPLLNKPQPFKYVVVPHEVYPKDIRLFKQQITVPAALYSQRDTVDLASFNVLIVDTIGLLKDIYRYADIAYVGGGFTKRGLHNVLEPAVFKRPIVIGPHYERFYEAADLVAGGGLVCVQSTEGLKTLLHTWAQDPEARREAGQKNYNYLVSNQGATKRSFDEICSHLEPPAET